MARSSNSIASFIKLIKLIAPSEATGSNAKTRALLSKFDNRKKKLPKYEKDRCSIVYSFAKDLFLGTNLVLATEFVRHAGITNSSQEPQAFGVGKVDSFKFKDISEDLQHKSFFDLIDNALGILDYYQINQDNASDELINAFISAAKYNVTTRANSTLSEFKKIKVSDSPDLIWHLCLPFKETRLLAHDPSEFHSEYWKQRLAVKGAAFKVITASVNHRINTLTTLRSQIETDKHNNMVASYADQFLETVYDISKLIYTAEVILKEFGSGNEVKQALVDIINCTKALVDKKIAEEPSKIDVELYSKSNYLNDLSTLIRLQSFPLPSHLASLFPTPHLSNWSELAITFHELKNRQNPAILTIAPPNYL